MPVYECRACPATVCTYVRQLAREDTVVHDGDDLTCPESVTNHLPVWRELKVSE